MNMEVKEFTVQFVDYMPEVINQGELYVSMKYSVVIHLCACGCGEKVVTPLSPDDWQLKYDGETISLYPSIGNWDFPCRSHYWVRKNMIVNAERWDVNGTQMQKTLTSNRNKTNRKPKKGKSWKRLMKAIFPCFL